MHTSCMAGSEYRHNRKVSQALSGKRAIAMTVALEPNSPCNSHSEQTNKHLWVQWHELNVRKYEHVNSKYTSKPSSYSKVSEKGGDIQSCTSWACTGLEGQSQSWTGLVLIPLPCRGQCTPVYTRISDVYYHRPLTVTFKSIFSYCYSKFSSSQGG